MNATTDLHASELPDNVYEFVFALAGEGIIINGIIFTIQI